MQALLYLRDKFSDKRGSMSHKKAVINTATAIRQLIYFWDMKGDKGTAERENATTILLSSEHRLNFNLMIYAVKVIIHRYGG